MSPMQADSDGTGAQSWMGTSRIWTPRHPQELIAGGDIHSQHAYILS